MKGLLFAAFILLNIYQAAAQQISIDSTFNNCPDIYWFRCMAVQPDNKIIVGLGYLPPVSSPSLVIRLNEDGSVDPSFYVDTFAISDSYLLNSLQVQADGRILVSAARDGLTKFLRLNSNGSRDSLFDAGTGQTNNGTCTIFTIAQQPDDKILISGGLEYYNGYATDGCARLHPDGTIDSAFRLNGSFFFNTFIYAMILQPDLKIIAGGLFTGSIARLNPDGSTDSLFQANVDGGFDQRISALALQPDGKIIAGGYFTSYNQYAVNTICRLNADGTLDTTFAPGTGFDNLIESIVVESDGKILVGGLFQTYNGDSCSSMVRLNKDGSLDTTFNHGSGFGVGQVLSMCLDSKQRLCVGGNFFKFNGATVPDNIERFNLHISPPVDTDTFVLPLTEGHVYFWPNPTSRYCTLSCTDTISRIIVTDILGRTLLTVSPGLTQANLDFGAFTCGLYLAKIEAGNKQYVIHLVRQ